MFYGFFPIHSNFEVNRDSNFKCTRIFFSADTVATAVLLVTRAALQCVCRVHSRLLFHCQTSKRRDLFIYFFYRACTRVLVLNTSTLEPHVVRMPYSTICPCGTDGNGRAYQNRFKARLISRSAQIKPLALSEPSTDEQTRERNELRSNTCLTYVCAKEKYIQVISTIN